MKLRRTRVHTPHTDSQPPRRADRRTHDFWPIGLRPPPGRPPWPEGSEKKVGRSRREPARRGLGGPPNGGRPSAVGGGHALAPPRPGRCPWAVARRRGGGMVAGWPPWRAARPPPAAPPLAQAASRTRKPISRRRRRARGAATGSRRPLHWDGDTPSASAAAAAWAGRRTAPPATGGVSRIVQRQPCVGRWHRARQALRGGRWHRRSRAPLSAGCWQPEAGRGGRPGTGGGRGIGWDGLAAQAPPLAVVDEVKCRPL